MADVISHVIVQSKSSILQYQ